MQQQIATPKTDAFAPTVIVMLNDDDFVSVDAAVRVAEQIRNAMMQWAAFARELESGTP